jgi:hypothetical protein
MTDKQSVLEKIESAYNDFQEAVKGLDRDKLEVVFYDQWSVKDIVAHILGWEREMTEALHRIARGERPTPEGVDYSDSDAWNAKFAERFRGQLPSAALEEWDRVHGGFINAMSSVPDDRFGEGKSVNRIAEATGYGHYKEHTPPINEWRAKEGI